MPSAYFLHLVECQAKLIYNAGHGTARELREIIRELKDRVRAMFHIELEEEVQYVGFD